MEKLSASQASFSTNDVISIIEKSDETKGMVLFIRSVNQLPTTNQDNTKKHPKDESELKKENFKEESEEKPQPNQEEKKEEAEIEAEEEKEKEESYEDVHSEMDTPNSSSLS